MPVLLLLLALGVFAYLFWRSRSSGLTRDCRWRQSRALGQWNCAFCGAEQSGSAPPRNCARAKQPSQHRDG